MELNLPPTPPQQPATETPPPSGYQNASQAASQVSSTQVAPTIPLQEVEVPSVPLIPVKRRRIHMGRLLVLLLVLAGIGTGLFYGGSYLYRRFLAKPATSGTATQDTSPFTYTGLVANQPLLFSYPNGWQVTPTTTGFTVAPSDATFTSEGKSMPAYAVEILALSRPLSSEQLAKSYVSTSFKVIINQSTTFVGLSIPSYVVVTTHESLTFSTLKNGTSYMVVSQPVLDTQEDRVAAKKAAQLFMSSVRFEE